MNLNPIAANMNEVQFPGGLTVLFSYKTPVACRWSNGIEQTVYKTEKKWSNTTTRHINKWIVLTDNWTDRKIVEKPQEYFDHLISEVK
jgi:hypothetical protein